jgi:hypothetical protein
MGNAISRNVSIRHTVKIGNGFVSFANCLGGRILLGSPHSLVLVGETSSCISMKELRTFLMTLAAVGLSLATQGQSILPAMIPNNVSPTFTTGDGLFTIQGFSDSASTTPKNLTTAGGPGYFGVEANGALDNTDTMKLQFAPGVGFSGFGDIWTRAVITISGFVSDPGLTPVGSPAGILSSGYSAGVLTLSLNWNGGTPRDFALSAPGASAGQTLTVSMDYATTPQWAITHLDYAAVPEPGTVALVALGGVTALLAARRFRR